MKIISWDIGEINLAYCIIEYDINLNNSIQNYNILEWNIIDILEDIREPEHLCNGILKNNKICNKKASYREIKENITLYYCKVHSKKINENNIKKLIKNEECECINKNGKKCIRKAQYYEIQNNNKIYFCKLHKNKIMDVNNINKYINSCNISFYERSNYMINKLDQYLNIFNVDYVIIENQPVHLNPIMKSIQMILYSYYLLRGKLYCNNEINKETNGISQFSGKDEDTSNENINNKIKKIYLINATQKMKVYDGQKIECNIKNKHNKNKFLSKEYCKYYIENDKKWYEYYKTHKKRDDLADTYLQGIYFIKNMDKLE